MGRSGHVTTEPNRPHFLTRIVTVDRAEYWRYSTARNYAGEVGLIGIDRWWQPRGGDAGAWER